MNATPSVTVQHLDSGATISHHGGNYAGDSHLVWLTGLIDKTEIELRVGTEYVRKGDPSWPLACMIASCSGRGVVVGGTSEIAAPGCIAEGEEQ